MIHNMRKSLIKISREKSGKIGVRVTYQVRIYPRNRRISEPYSEINELSESPVIMRLLQDER